MANETAKRLIAPNGSFIAGTSETIFAMYPITVLGRSPEGAIEWEYSGEEPKFYDETSEPRTDKAGAILFQAADGRDWPLCALRIEDEPETTPATEQSCEEAAQDDASAAAVRALLAVANGVQACINAADCEHPDFRDSGADVCQMLAAMAAQVKAALLLAQQAGIA